MKTIVPDHWNIPTQIRERFGDSAGRQRAMSADGHLIVVLHEPPSPNNKERKPKIVWRNPAGDWTWSVNGSTTHLLKNHVAQFAELAEHMENELQAASGADAYFRLLQAISPLHRSSRNMHAALQQARDMIPDDREIIAARDAAGDVERAFELLYVDAKNGLDYTVAQKAEVQSQRTYEMAVSAHRLNVLAAVFFPITALSSIFAMNYSLGPETFMSTSLFWGVIGVGSLSGLLLSKAIVQKQIVVAPKPQSQMKSKLKRGSTSKQANSNQKQAISGAQKSAGGISQTKQKINSMRIENASR